MKADEIKNFDKVFTEYLSYVSSSEESEGFLRENGFDPDQLVNEGLGKVRKIQMQIASEKTEAKYHEMRANLLQKAKNEVDKILGEFGFNLESFIKRENINLAYRNFENMNEGEIREFLERHFLLKYQDELKG